MLERDLAANVFEEQRPYLFSIAYRLLGSVGDAEDMLQEAFLRWDQDRQPTIRSPRAYLATIVVRLCMDQLRSARARREVYVGPWLPEPLLTTGRAELTDSLIMRESLSFAFLLMLENLSPLERAVFVLREVFDYDYPDIAEAVGKTTANCRQVFHRARQRMAERQSRFETTTQQQAEVTEQFIRATTTGDVHDLLRVLSEDVVSISDGGGKVSAALRPIVTRDRVLRGFVGNLPKMPFDRVWLEDINGQPAAVAMLHGRVYGVLLLEIRGGQVERLYAVVNPDKLEAIERHLRATGRMQP